MALIECRFRSRVLELSCTMNVILPQPEAMRIPARGFPTLYLLHGISDDHSAWLRQTSIERHVEKLGLAVVMPAFGRSFYTDIAGGPRYWQFLAEELPQLARGFFPLSAAREDNFVAGLSMGGYGAFKLALRAPESFAAAASLSGALDMVSRVHCEQIGKPGELFALFGPAEGMADKGDDLFALATALAAAGRPCPRLLQRCGTEDFLFADNERFAAHARELGLPLDYAAGPGSHDWAYWDAGIREVLAWLPLAQGEGA